MRWIWSSSPLNHHYPFEGLQTYTIINVCVFVNRVQMEMEVHKV